MIGVVTGVRREAACLRKAPINCHVACSGAVVARAMALARNLAAEPGVTGLVSFGVAGALVADLAPGTLLLPEQVTTPAGASFTVMREWRDRLLADNPGRGGAILSVSSAVTTPAIKHELAEKTGAIAVDMESAAIAAIAKDTGLPFVVVRAVADPAGHGLPDAALAAVTPDGGVDIRTLLRSLWRHPVQIAALVRLSLDSAAALGTLSRVAARLREPS